MVVRSNDRSCVIVGLRFRGSVTNSVSEGSLV